LRHDGVPKSLEVNRTLLSTEPVFFIKREIYTLQHIRTVSPDLLQTIVASFSGDSGFGPLW
jgi:hypothetical protein